jgi:hypothetical protein
MANKIIDDTECIQEWRTLVGEFNKLTENSPQIEKVRENLVALQNKAKNNALLTHRQVDGVFSRCENYLNGTYGRSKDGITTSAYDTQRQNGRPEKK